MNEPATRADFVWHYDSLSTGRSAIAYWEALNANLQTPDLLIDLLLIEQERANDPIAVLKDGLLALRESSNEQQAELFCSESYAQLVQLNRQPELNLFSEANLADVEQTLTFGTDPVGLGAMIAQRFTIQQRLGAGSFGVVFRAVDKTNNDSVAVKAPLKIPGRMGQRCIEMLSSEAIVAESIQSFANNRPPELVRDRGLPFLVMPFIDGPSLRDLINQGPIPADEAVRIMIEVFRTLARAHERKILHRDVKPDKHSAEFRW